MNLDLIYISCIGLTLLIGLIFTVRSSHISFKLLLIFLFITFANELTAWVLHKVKHYNTHLLYNIYNYFRFPFLVFIFSKVLPGEKPYTTLIKWFYYLVPVLFVVCLVYNGLFKLHILYVASGYVFLILLCVGFFYSHIKKEELQNPLLQPFFWISTGFLFYFLGILPYMVLVNYLVKNYLSIAQNYYLIVKILNFVLYSLISLDYIIQWRKRT